MTQTKFFSGVAIPMVLATTIDANAASDPVVNLVTGLPSSYPFIVTVDLGVYSGSNLIQEAMLVTSAPVNNGDGTWTLPVTRGQDGTTIQAHSSNAVVVHTTTAQDSTDARVHIDTSTAVHGLSGAVAGTTDTQTLTNKTLTGAVVSADPSVALGVASKQYVDALSGSATVNTGAITAGSIVTATVTVTGAATGQTVLLGLPSTWSSQLNAGVIVTAYVSSASTVTLVVKNSAATSQTPPSATVNVKVR